MVLTVETTGDVKQATKDNINSQFTHMAFGDGTFSGLTTATTLGNVVTTVARQEFTELTNSVIISGFLNATQGNGSDIKEAGAREGSTGTFQSGRNITRVSKTASKELWVDEEVDILVTQEEL